MNDTVTLIEVGPRDGFQLESKIIPTEFKMEIISGLGDAGLRHIQVTSFVNPARVPQMADAEELLRRLPKRDDVVYSGLVLNTKGVERAYRAGLHHIEVSISASNTHSEKNTGMTLNEAIKQAKEMVQLSLQYGMNVAAGIQCAFGCVYEGKIPEKRILEIARQYIEYGVDRISIADTTGMAAPLLVKSLLSLLIPETKETPLSLHFHDTRGLGLVNVMAAMECGITCFDTALGGMGGCPFVPGAAGNIATEDTAYLMESLNIHTGVSIAKVTQCTRKIEKFLGKPFAGKMYRLSR